MHPVVIACRHRKFDRAWPAVGEAMAVGPHVVTKRRAIDDAVAHQRHAQLLGKFTVRRAIADRSDAEPTLQRLKTPLQFFLDPRIAGIRQEMVITVMADLVTGLE